VSRQSVYANEIIDFFVILWAVYYDAVIHNIFGIHCSIRDKETLDHINLTETHQEMR